MSGRLRPLLKGWVRCLLLATPAAIPYLAHYSLDRPYSRPTGYIQEDMPIYMAKAREYFDAGPFRGTYGNPCDDSDSTPRIYFQPWTAALGLIREASGLPPGAIFVGFWIVSVISCSFLSITLYRRTVGLETTAQRLGLVAFFWGGGLLAAAGAGLTLGEGKMPTWKSIFALDPFDGWWFLNFGRNLVYPTEAYYHAVFFACMVCVLGRRFRLAAGLAALLGASTPFTGLQLLAILWAWGALEVLFLEDRERVRGFFLTITVLLALFLGYYLGFLNRYPNHRVLAAQMALNWGISAANFLPAYALVGGLALWRLRTLRRAAAVLAESRNRLFLVWAAVSFLLENHEFAIAPRQPIHFTRGYLWTGLFLLGAPTLVEMFDTLARRRRGRVWVGLLLLLILSDNLAWFGRFARAVRSPIDNGVCLNDDQHAVLRRLADPSFSGFLLLSEDPWISYLALVESPVRSWASHRLETPHFSERRAQLEALFRDGEFRNEWDSRRLLIVRLRRGSDDPPGWLRDRRAERIFANRKYDVYRVLPGRPSRGPGRTGSGRVSARE